MSSRTDHRITKWGQAPWALAFACLLACGSQGDQVLGTVVVESSSLPEAGSPVREASTFMPDTGPLCRAEPAKPATLLGLALQLIIDRSQSMFGDPPPQMYPDGFAFDKWDSLVSALGEVFNSSVLNGAGV